MRMILLGPPGCGKGTQADRLSVHFGVPRLTTGEMLRAAVRAKTSIGRQVEGIMAGGALVPDALAIGLMRDRMQAPDCRDGYILDGFPRNRAQGEALEQLLQELGQQLDVVVLFDVPETEIVRRLAGRRECRSCGTAYHIDFQPPRQIDRCDRCGGELYQRDDDTEGTIHRRLDVYRQQTSVLAQYYRDRGILHRVNGIGSPDAVFGLIRSLIAPAS